MWLSMFVFLRRLVLLFLILGGVMFVFSDGQLTWASKVLPEMRGNEEYLPQEEIRELRNLARETGVISLQWGDLR
jgi:cell division septal protein FtsQ